MKRIFLYQQWHVLILGLLLVLLNFTLNSDADFITGSLSGVNTLTWFWIAIAVPIVHQIYVWLVWRFELYQHTFSQWWGMQRAFRLYAIGFAILFIGRLIVLIPLAISNRNTLSLNVVYTCIAIVVITLPVIFLFYSVKKYFTVERAFGIDHFDRGYNEPYVKKGIFRYTDNGMYIYGLMILYLPGLIYQSDAALLAALFNHVYIWVHYYCTELPDMRVIYGSEPGNENKE